MTEQIYNLDLGVAAGFGIPGFRLGEDLYYPTNIATMGRLPLVIIGHGNGHDFRWYDHIGNHLASYGYIVMSHDNDTGPDRSLLRPRRSAIRTRSSTRRKQVPSRAEHSSATSTHTVSYGSATAVVPKASPSRTIGCSTAP